MSSEDMPIWLRESAATGANAQEVTEDAREKLEAALAALRPLVGLGLIEVRGMVAHLTRRLNDVEHRLGVLSGAG